VHGRHTLAIMPNVDYAFIVALVVVILNGDNADGHGDAATTSLNVLNGVVEGLGSAA